MSRGAGWGGYAVGMPIRSLLVVVGASLLSGVAHAVPVLAQEVNKAREGNAWIGYVVAAVLALIVAVVSFLGSKRTHEDA